MKKVVLAIVILAVILTAGILETVYVDKVFHNLDSRLCDVEKLIVAEDSSALDETNSYPGGRNAANMPSCSYTPPISALCP